jgi:opacity protein-like surface antigen
VSDSQDFSGFGYGLGVKHLVTQHLYLYVEVEQRVYETRSFSALQINVRPEETLGTFGVGWKF